MKDTESKITSITEITASKRDEEARHICEAAIYQSINTLIVEGDTHLYFIMGMLDSIKRRYQEASEEEV